MASPGKMHFLLRVIEMGFDGCSFHQRSRLEGVFKIRTTILISSKAGRQADVLKKATIHKFDLGSHSISLTDFFGVPQADAFVR